MFQVDLLCLAMTSQSGWTMDRRGWLVGLLWLSFSLWVAVLAEDIPEPPEEPAEEEDWPSCEGAFLDGKYSMPHSKFCDRFFACQNAIPYLMQCEDGFGYAPFRGCKLLHLVDCTGRPRLQRPRGNKECPRLYGIFNDPRGCGRFFKCVNGTAVEDRCATSLMFDDEEKVCRSPSKEEEDACKPTTSSQANCKPFDVECSKFQCPNNDLYPFGDHSRHRYPGHCRYFIMCLKDGSTKVGGCQAGTTFSDVTSTCEPQESVQKCKHARSYPVDLY